MKRERTKRESIPHATPQNIEELAKSISHLGSLKRKAENIIAKADEKISKIQEEVSQSVSPISEEIEMVFDAIYNYAESNRDELTDKGKKKTIKLATGKLSWRTTPPKVTIGNTEEVIETLKKLKLSRFLRIKEEIDRNAMIKERKVAEKIKGVSITQSEELAVIPNETASEIKRLIPSK